MSAEDDVAIVGMACLFPGAPDLAQFAANLAAGVDAIGEVPANRWDPVFYDPASHATDRFYCKRGGFVDENAWFDAIAHGVMPVAAAAGEPDQLLALEVAHRAFLDAGLENRDFDRRRAGVFLGRGSYPGAGRARLDQHVRGAEQLIRALRRLAPSLDERALAAVKKDFQAQLAAAGPDAAIGLVPNLAASRIAHRLDLQGPAWTVDAACASALVAAEQAVFALRSQRLDLVLCGGVHFCQDEAFWSVFTQLGALSRAQSIRPFSASADGLLIGEGAGIVALMRREDADKMGLRSYALIRGVGSSSDGRGASLMSPAVEGQVAALTEAWRDAGLDPATVGLIEAHGTATPTGDAAELSTLRRVFGEARGVERAALGSVKSMIGHTMPAAGAAGLIKAALSLHQQTLFPSLHAQEPHPALAATRFRIPSKSEPWIGASPRRAGVSAFGFGGINAHVVLEETASHASTRVHAAARSSGASQHLLLLAAKDSASLIRELDHRPHGPLGRAGEGPLRIAIVDPTPERIAKARQVIERGKAWRGREGIFFGGGSDLAKSGIAFLYPGVDTAQKSRLGEVAAHFGQKVSPEALSDSIEHQGIALVEAGRVLTHALSELGVEPALALGHSVGEWTGMIATGMLREEQFAPFLERARSETLEVPGVAFAAVGASAQRAEALLEGLAHVAVSHDNCPHQVILCGVDAAVDEALRRARAVGLLGQKLPFRSGFHSPLFAPYLGVHQESFAKLELHPPRFPLWSATSCAPYPLEPEAIRALALRHLVEPVRFRTLVRNVYDAGARVFVQLGPGSALGFVEDTLRGEPHAVVSAAAADRGGLEQLWRVAALLFAEGKDVRAELLLPVEERRMRARSGPLKLSLGVPLVALHELAPELSASMQTAPGAAARDRTLAAPASSGPSVPPPAASVPPPRSAASSPEAPAGPLAAAFHGLLADVQTASSDVLSRLSLPPPPRATMPPPPRATAPPPVRAAAPSAGERAADPAEPIRVARRLSVETHPWLLDHTFFRQPPGWTVASDRHPVVPMTTTIQMMMDEAQRLAPGKLAIAVEQVSAYRWLAIGAPTDVNFELTWRGPERVHVAAVGFAEATIVLADRYPSAPPAPAFRGGGEPSRIGAGEMYAQRWMFHGPLFQGVRAIGPLRDDGLSGEIETGASPGALLDNAGQLYGFWVMQKATQDRLAMPTGVSRLRFFGPHPAPGARAQCEVIIRSFDARRVVADLSLVVEGRLWCAIEGWEDRRFDSDDRLWNVLIWPEKSLLAEPIAAAAGDAPGRAQSGPLLFRDTYRAAPTREQLFRRYLGAPERAEYEALSPRSQRSWLNGRIAAKDAVRALLRTEGVATMFPVEIRISNGPGGEPRATAPGGRDVRISLAHKGEHAVAMASFDRPVGVDLETVAPRPSGFEQTAFTPAELSLIGPGDDRDEWLARLWTAKEAAGKRAGTGLAGDPKRWPVTDRAGERLLCAGQQVETRRFSGIVVAWTLG